MKCCNRMITIQEEKHPAGDGTMQHPDSQQSCQARTVWKRRLSLWLKRKNTSKTFMNQSLTNAKESSDKPLNGFWRWLSLRHLMLLPGSGHPYLVTCDHLHICQSAVESLQPCFMSSPLMNRCFLDDGELVTSPHKDRIAGRPFLETRQSSRELLSSDISQRDRATCSSNMFSMFQRHITPEMRLHFGEESDPDLEELLAEDEVDGGCE